MQHSLSLLAQWRSRVTRLAVGGTLVLAGACALAPSDQAPSPQQAGRVAAYPALLTAGEIIEATAPMPDRNEEIARLQTRAWLLRKRAAEAADSPLTEEERRRLSAGTRAN